jgi:hypothetical protein
VDNQAKRRKAHQGKEKVKTDHVGRDNQSEISGHRAQKESAKLVASRIGSVITQGKQAPSPPDHGGEQQEHPPRRIQA